MSSEELKRLVDWIKEKSTTIEYGEISIVLKFHSRELRHVEKHVMTNEVPSLTRAGSYHDKTET